LDSVLLGASVADDAGHILDLGAGAGVAGLVALAGNARARLTMVERDPEMAALGIANAAANECADRTTGIVLDVCAPGADRRAAGLIDNAYDQVIANPPFFTSGAGTPAGVPARSAARHMPVEALDGWARTAAASATGGGGFILVYPATGLTAVLAAFETRFGAVTVLPLTPRPEAPATRILVRGIKGSRAPLTLLASRTLHDADGRGFAAGFEAIFRGTGRLDW
jgi:tRNA1(Val) A37 N6-methylase TrmN6